MDFQIIVQQCHTSTLIRDLVFAYEKKVEISFYCNFVKNTICFCNEFIVTLQILYKTYYEGADNKKLIILFVD